MFFDRRRYKSFALQELKISWVTPLIVCFIAMFVGGTLWTMLYNYMMPANMFSNMSYSDIMTLYSSGYIDYMPSMMSGYFGGMAVILSIGSIFYTALVSSPLDTAAANYFINAPQGRRSAAVMFEPLSANYLNVVLVNFIVNLKIALFSFLLVVPGIIKMYEYRYVQYILSENPNISAKQAMAMSKALSDGHKMDIFITDFSFIGWQIVAGFVPFGLGKFILAPYLQGTFAQMYLDAKEILNYNTYGGPDMTYGGPDTTFNNEQ